MSDLSWLGDAIAEIKKENGLSPDDPGITCLRCRKMVQSSGGLLHCDCHDERVGIDPNHPDVVVIDGL